MLIDLNGETWNSDPSDIDEAEEAMLAVAAREVASMSPPGARWPQSVTP